MIQNLFHVYIIGALVTAIIISVALCSISMKGYKPAPILKKILNVLEPRNPKMSFTFSVAFLTIMWPVFWYYFFNIIDDMPKRETLDFSDQKLREMASWPGYNGFTAAICGSCSKTANVLIYHGWFCECGESNSLPWDCDCKLYEHPDMGPSKLRIIESYKSIEVNSVENCS